jgi:ankyrin repeat protein
LSGKERIVSHLISLGADVEYKNSKGDSCLMKACEKGNENIMEMLLEKFSNSFSNSYSPKRILALLTAQNKDGNTCLMNACAKGNLKVTVYLIRKMQEQLNKIGYSQYTSPPPVSDS